VSDDVKNWEPWTDTIQEVWPEYQSSTLPKDPWQASYQMDSVNDLSSDSNHSLMSISIPSTGATPPTMVKERDLPTSRDEDTSAFPETQQKQQFWQQARRSKKKRVDRVDSGRRQLTRLASRESHFSDIEGREGTDTCQVSQSKRQCVYGVVEAVSTQYHGAVPEATDSLMPVYNSGTYYPFLSSLGSHQSQNPGWEQIKHDALNCSYEALQCRTVTHGHITMQQNYTSGFHSDQFDYHNIAPCWPIPVYGCPW
jgi:hypothetical protein